MDKTDKEKDRQTGRLMDTKIVKRTRDSKKNGQTDRQSERGGRMYRQTT